MHIAVCDDNVADRKQFERLIRRESERRGKENGILFADLFGNADSLLANPMQYDAFYIDMCKTPGVSVEQIVTVLTEKGVNVPIILCCSDIDYRSLNLPGDISFLDKPIKPEELSVTVEHALEVKANAVPLIELREEKETFYVTEPDILYAIQDGLLIAIYLKDGRVVHTMDNALNLFSQLESFPTFLVPTAKAMINGRYIKAFKFRKVVMIDGKVFKISSECIPYAKKIFAEYAGSDANE